MSFLLNPFRFQAAAPSGLQADPGAFVLTGNDVALKRSLFMSAAAGSFALTGNDVSLKSGVRVLADAGAFALAGQDAGMKRALRMDAGAGSFALAGNAATLTYAGAPAPDPHFANVVLLAGFDGVDGSTTFIDDSNTPHTLTAVGNAQIDTAQSKFSGASLLMDGTGDWVSVPDSADWSLAPAMGDQFTVECFARFSGSVPASAGFVSQYTASSGTAAWAFRRASSQLQFVYYPAGQTIAAAWSPAANTWYHVCVDRDASDAVRLYVDGVMIGKATATGAIRDATVGLLIGTLGGLETTYDWAGWMDEVRITKGVARYASDAGFTVPTAAFPRS